MGCHFHPSVRTFSAEGETACRDARHWPVFVAAATLVLIFGAAAVPLDLRPQRRDCLPGRTSDGFIMRGHPNSHRRAATPEGTTLPSPGRGLMAQTPDVCRDR